MLQSGAEGMASATVHNPLHECVRPAAHSYRGKEGGLARARASQGSSLFERHLTMRTQHLEEATGNMSFSATLVPLPSYFAGLG